MQRLSSHLLVCHEYRVENGVVWFFCCSSRSEDYIRHIPVLLTFVVCLASFHQTFHCDRRSWSGMICSS